jgi:hypothetical protein
VLHDNKFNHLVSFILPVDRQQIYLTGTAQCQDRRKRGRQTFPLRHFHANRFVTLTINFPAVHWGAVPPYRPVLDSSAHNRLNHQFLSMPSFCQGDLSWHHFHLYVVYLGLFLLLSDIFAPPSIRCIPTSYLHCLPFYFKQYKRIQLVSYSVVSHLIMQGTVATPLSNFITASEHGRYSHDFVKLKAVSLTLAILMFVTFVDVRYARSFFRISIFSANNVCVYRSCV